MRRYPSILRTCAVLFLFASTALTANAQITPSDAGYIDAVADYGAVNDGATVTTTQLQAAMDAAITEGKGLFLPAGEYLVDGTLHIRPPKSDQKFVMQGSTIDPANRSVIVLKAGTFPTFTSNAKSALGFVIQNDYGYDDIGTTTTYERVVQGINVKIQENNAGAVALNFRGAEGTCLFDVDIDAAGAYAGIYELPGSGGTVADISITGGQVGIDITEGTQPTPTITYLRMSGQTVCGIKSGNNRGAITITGANVRLDPGVNFFQGQRMTSFALRFGGCPVITDSRFEYTAESSENILFTFTDNSLDASINFSNVYVKHAEAIVSTSHGADATAAGNGSGWRHYEQFNYDAGEWVDGSDTFDDGIYLEGVRQAGNLFSRHSDVTESDIPLELTAIHGWGETFPSFESTGAINVTDYSGLVDNGDWAPAFNAAVQAAAQTQSNVVFVPTGTYDIYQTIHLGKHTKLIGVSHHHTEILGWDESGRRFDGGTDAWNDPRPMIETPDDPSADNILADMGVRMVGPFNNVSHNPEPCVHYALLWRSGPNSIIRNLNTEPKTSTNYRPVYVMTFQLSNANWISLRAIEGEVLQSSFSFTQDNASQFLNHTLVPAGHWLETVDGSKRLMAKSISPFNSFPGTLSEVPNITIRKSDYTAFDFSSLKVAQASFNPLGGGDIIIDSYNSGGLVASDTVFIAGIDKPRDIMEHVTLDLQDILEIKIRSEVMFSIDDVVADGVTIDFESLDGETPAVGTGIESALYYDCARDLPLGYLNHHIVRIEGGVKWYNHRKHGDTWMRPTQAYVAVINNDAPVNFYHFHAQHSQNDQKLYIENGRDVTVWGVKTENAGYLARTIDSDNIRFYGHGGLTTPPPGTSHYYFENTTNYSVSAPTDELDREDYCQYCSNGSAILPQSAVGTYTSLQEVNDGSTLAPDPYHRPIIWERGSPEAAYYGFASSSIQPSIALVHPANGTTVSTGTNVELSAAAVTPVDTILAVEFYESTSLLGRDTITPFQFDHVFNEAGDFLLSVKALTADSTWIVSTINSVLATDVTGIVPEIAISSPVDLSVYSEGDNTTLSVQILESNKDISSVEFFSNGTPLGIAESEPYDFLWEDLNPGTYMISAVATDIDGVSSSAMPVTIRVNSLVANQLPQVNLTAPASNSTIFADETVTISALAEDVDGQILIVKFYADHALIASDQLAPYQVNWIMPAPGEHQITALAYDNDGEYATSSPVTVDILSAPEVQITQPEPNSVFLVNEEISIKAQASSISGTISEVRFYAGDILIHTDTEAPYENTHAFVEKGAHVLSVEVEDEYGQIRKDQVTVQVRLPKGPYGGVPAELPGYIEMELFDEGGNGVAYLDDDARNANQYFRADETVDIRNNANPLYDDDTLAIGNVLEGEWIEYTVDVVTPGTYQFTLEAAGPRPVGEPSGGTYDRGYAALYIDGDSIGAVMITNTSDNEYGPEAWHSWTPFHIDDVTLTAGEHVVRWVSFGAYNVNRLSFLAPNEPPTVIITLPLNDETLEDSEDVLITVQASDDGAIEKVEIYGDDQLIGTDTESPYEFTWTGADVGDHTLYAIAYDDQGLFTLSETVSFEVVHTNAIGLYGPSGSLQAYPNPCHDVFRIDVPFSVELGLYEMSGRKLMILDDYAGSQVNVSGIDPGMYFIRIEKGNERVQLKLVIE